MSKTKTPLNKINESLTRVMDKMVKDKIIDAVGEENVDKYNVSVDGIEGIDNRFNRFVEELLFFNAREFSEKQLEDIKDELKVLLKPNCENGGIDLNDLSFLKEQYVTNLMECFQHTILRDYKYECVELLMALLYNWKDCENDSKSE